MRGSEGWTKVGKDSAIKDLMYYMMMLRIYLLKYQFPTTLLSYLDYELV